MPSAPTIRLEDLISSMHGSEGIGVTVGSSGPAPSRGSPLSESSVTLLFSGSLAVTTA